MNTPSDPAEPTYTVVPLDRADADIEAAYNHLRPLVGDDKANQWVRELLLTLFNLAAFPGPLAHPIDEAVSRLTGQTVRRMLFRGGTRQKPIGAAYRVYFYTVAAQSDSERSGIFILRVLHGAADQWPAAKED